MTDTIDDLERKITEQQALLSQYEHTEALEDDPRRRMRTQETIEEIKTFILGYQTRLAELRRDTVPPPPPPPPPPPTTLLANAPYGLEAELVGRQNELLLLDDWFRRDPDHPFLTIVALGGMGKSALTWAWLQDLIRQKQAPPLAVWWSFYETDGSMVNLTAELLRHFGDDPAQFSSLRAAMTRCVEHLRQTPALLILDGAERLLRAYGSMAAAYQADESESGLEFQQARQCVDPVSGMLLQWLAQPGYTQAMTLMTSRLFPLDLSGRSGGLLQGVRRHDLTGLSPDAALHLFHGLGVRASRAEVEAVGGPLGYHPLSLRLLAGYAAADPQRPNDLSAAAAYDPTSDLLGKRQHILTQAYNTLPAPAQHTLSRLAAFRGGVSWPVIETIFGGGKQIRNDLTLLDQRGLIQRTVPVVGGASTVYDLHPIVRRYAYERLADRAGVHTQLVVYFEAIPNPEKVRTLADLAPTIELYHHLARAGRFDEACDLYYDRLHNPLYFQLGAYQQTIELLRTLFPDGEDRPPRLSKEADQVWTLGALSSSYSLSGRPAMAVPLFEQDIAILERAGDKKNLAIDLDNLAITQLPLGALKTAEANLHRRIDLCREIEDRFREAVGHQELGRLLAYRGDWAGSAVELDAAFEQFTNKHHIQGQSLTWAYRALAALLRGEANAAGEAAREALRLADEDARTTSPVERDYVRAHWLLGWATLAGDDLAQAQPHLDEALRRCRAINMVDHEPAILLAQARLAHKRRELAETHQLVEEARQIAERAGYRLDLADIHNLLAHLALAAGKRAEARQQAQQARDYAWCDGPPHAYQVALEEAERLLRELGVQNPPPSGRG